MGSHRSLATMVVLGLAFIVPCSFSTSAAERPAQPQAGHDLAGPSALEHRRSAAGQGRHRFGKLPIAFERNQGQVDARVKFLTRSGRALLFLLPTETILRLVPPERDSRPEVSDVGGRTATLRMKLIGGNPAEITGEDELPGRVNYFLGATQGLWRTNIPTYAQVRYRNVYPGVDVVFHGDQERLEYDFIVAPNADPKRISVAFEGADDLKIDDRGDLVMRAADRQISHRKPFVYQDVDGTKREIAGRYLVDSNGRVGFEVGAYDVTRPLVIDPVVLYSTYMGGDNTDIGRAIAVDALGNAFITGRTASTAPPPFPPAPAGAATSASSFQPSLAGGTDAFVVKLNTAGTAVIYATYLGGDSTDDGRGIRVDNLGNAYVTGFTSSTNFPTTATAFQAQYGGNTDAFVAKLSADGSALEYSTYLGGGGEDVANAIALDAEGNAYVTGHVLRSGDGQPNFPTLNALQAVHAGGFWDAFVAKLNSTGSGLVYSTYLGGRARDRGYGVAVDAAGNAYVTGETFSFSDFPTGNALQSTCRLIPATGGCSGDLFVTKLSATGAGIFSTYLGGTGQDGASAVGVDAVGNVYVTGWTASSDFPTANAWQSRAGGGAFDGFVTKFNASGSSLLYSTYLGGRDIDSASDIVVVAGGEAHIVGTTSSDDFPVVHAAQPIFGGGICGDPNSVQYPCPDAFLARLDPGGSPIFATYFGGSGDDQGLSVGVHIQGSNAPTYATGLTRASDLPTVKPLQPAYGGGPEDAFVVKIGDNPAPVAVFGLPAGEVVACTAPTATPVELDGSQSYDSDQQRLSYLWTGPFAGGTASGPTPTVALPIGPSTITLTVSDGELTGTASRTVTVNVVVRGLESPLGPLVPATTQPPLPTVAFQAGRTLPLKLGLACGSQKLTSSDVTPPKLVAVTRKGDLIAPTAAPVPITSTNDATGSFRSENTNWIYNLSTQGFAPGTYEVLIEMPDGVVYHTLISLR